MSYLMYSVPSQFYLRIHHVRPRFKSDIENVLIYVATEISNLPSSVKADFSTKLNNAIRAYPGNGSLEIKTINNWRTEISALFGFIEYKDGLVSPGRVAQLLAANQDLLEFFKYFLLRFQYPGGHLKPSYSLELIKAGVKFKPAQYIINVLLEGQKKLNIQKFGISKAEATHCIFNDLRSTTGVRLPKDTTDLILFNRESKFLYDESGDVVRYAGDVLDYMELAGLLKREIYSQKYYLVPGNLDVLTVFQNDRDYFSYYNSLYSNPYVTIENVNQTQDQWFAYANNPLVQKIFETDITEVLQELESEDYEHSELLKTLLINIKTDLGENQEVSTKKIGNVGESLTIEQEKARLRMLNRGDLISVIKKIPDHLGVGYDIQSHQGVDNQKKYIEVKTTISKGKLNHYSFHMTPNEWDAASTLKDAYYVFRVLISSNDIRLFQIHNPVGKYKESLLDMSPREGADIKYTEASGTWLELLV
jgi:hypothetical protein